MIFTDPKEKMRAKGWHQYFAWWPVQISEKIYFLETIERRLAGWYYPLPFGATLQWEYRKVGDESW